MPRFACVHCPVYIYPVSMCMLSRVNIFLPSLFLHVHAHQLVCSCICLPVYTFTPACVHITLLCTIHTGLRGSWVKNVMLYVQTSPDTMCLLTLFTYKVTPGYILHLHRYQSMVVKKVLLQDSCIFDIIKPPNGETGLSVLSTNI